MIKHFRTTALLQTVFVIALLSAVSSCDNKNAQDYINAGIRHTEEQEYDKAAESFRKAIKADPANALAHYTLGGIYTYKDMHQEAIAEYRKAIELDAAYPDPHYSLGFVYEKLGMQREADREYLIFKELQQR